MSGRDVNRDRSYSLPVHDAFKRSWIERERTSMGEKEEVRLPVPNRNYRDTVFRMLFREKKELLSLFNAIHGTSYHDPKELKVTTLENAVYMAMKNDISCVLGMYLDLYEHQSTVNPNMPLRDLFYVAKLLENCVKDQDLYSEKRITLPSPTFIVFYNGRATQPERRVYRLSDSFAGKEREVNLELVVLQININPGYNTELVESCPTLFQYIQYTNQVRQYSQTLPLAKAVEKSVDYCIREGILSDFLLKNKREVIPMSIFEYDEEKHMRTVRKEGYEDGVVYGTKVGMEQGKYQFICNMLRDHQAPELISKYAERPLEYVYQVEKQMLNEVREGSTYEEEKE